MIATVKAELLAVALCKPNPTMRSEEMSALHLEYDVAGWRTASELRSSLRINCQMWTMAYKHAIAEMFDGYQGGRRTDIRWIASPKRWILTLIRCQATFVFIVVPSVHEKLISLE